MTATLIKGNVEPKNTLHTTPNSKLNVNDQEIKVQDAPTSGLGHVGVKWGCSHLWGVGGWRSRDPFLWL